MVHVSASWLRAGFGQRLLSNQDSMQTTTICRQPLPGSQRHAPGHTGAPNARARTLGQTRLLLFRALRPLALAAAQLKRKRQSLAGMGLCHSDPRAAEAAELSRQVERDLQKRRREAERRVKVLLLGELAARRVPQTLRHDLGISLLFATRTSPGSRQNDHAYNLLCGRALSLWGSLPVTPCHSPSLGASRQLGQRADDRRLVTQ